MPIVHKRPSKPMAIWGMSDKSASANKTGKMEMSSRFGSNGPLSRRRALAVGGTLSGGLIAASTSAAFGAARFKSPSSGGSPIIRVGGGGTQLPVDQIEAILQAQGEVSESGVLSVEIDRNDLPNVTRNGVPFLPSFMINGTAYFQALGNGQAILNGVVALTDKEIDPFIDALVRNGLIFQAFHQHFYDLTPMIWFIHYRNIGDPLQLAQALFNSITQATSTPFPQPPPPQTTPLPADQLAQILGGSAMIGGNGVVTVNVPRADRIRLQGVPIAGDEGIGLDIAFEPLSDGTTVVAPDFSMTASEVMPVTRVMRQQGWDNNCLYNQETDEHPQLFFSHQVKIGDAVQLAQEVRNGANKTNLMFSS